MSAPLPGHNVASRVCVIVPSVNNAEELGVSLDGLAEQSYTDMEIVVVGPAGDPAIPLCKVRGVRFVDDMGSSNRADACNVGISETESELVFFTDDDVIVPTDWVEKLVHWFDKSDVAGVGGPNFAPVEESTISQKAIDVAFCNRFLTAGTNYGRQSGGLLEEVEQLPGVNSAYRRSVLDEVGGFDKGAIGAEDVMLDHRIRLSGYRLWSDGSAVMWHRRRGIGRVRKQIRNYGLVRTLASQRYPRLWGWSHNMVSAFPILVLLSFSAFIWGCLNGGIAWPEFWDVSTNTIPMGKERIAVHQFPTLVFLFNIIAWFGAYMGPSPSKGPSTILLSSVVSFLLLWDYGIGIMKARWGLVTGNTASQIDDRERGV